MGKTITITADPAYDYIVEEVDFPIELNDFKVLSFYQDREGFMWFGGVDGVIRYDGVRFKTFEYDPFDKHSVPFAWIFDIQQDDNNYIWLNGRSGLIKYDPENGRFRRFINPAPPHGNLEWNKFLSMALDHGSIWIGTQKGLCRFDTEREIFDSYTRFSKNNSDVRTYE
ncbi:MAG: two-component regulator propeller domain-containing protein [Bacteroidales bacterium]|nr:two-component regulator propeller domain-containing protein [Bacteroidales bacterium]MDT8432109.1 two-component regulator propeller domain-containing protein [Bacteroidales bacterium]